MRARRNQFARALAVFLLAAGVALPVAAQRGGGQGRGTGPHPGGGQGAAGGRVPRESPPRTEAEKKELREHRQARALVGLPPPWMERLRDMSPEQQHRFLSNNERFRNLPPERQAQIRRRLQHWNSLTPEQRQAFREREHIWAQMTPEQQRHVREELLPKWQQLPVDRRQVLLGKLRALRGLHESERAAKLNDPAFLSDLNPDERGMLQELSSFRVGAAPEPPPENPQP
ncbi:MAG: DUF3106 domain-containing protein [Acidobacteria bacterium]|nr:DUF3106 domain-containing protein [Acidobacteriota bacterium]